MTATAVTVLVSEPTRKTVSGVTGARVVTSVTPWLWNQVGSPSRTTATARPAVGQRPRTRTTARSKAGPAVSIRPAGGGGAVTIERLSADDRLLLLTDKQWPQDVGVVAILEGGPLLDAQGRVQVEVARAAVRRGLGRLPRLRQVLRVPPRGLGGPFWADDPSFDEAHHVRTGPRLESGDERALLGAVEQIRS